MAVLFELDEVAWKEWVTTRPPVIQKMCERLRPNVLYRLKTTGQRVTVYSLNENGTVTVNITGEYNLIDFDRQVFGINPDDLEECDIPKEEPLGTMLVQEDDIEQYVDAIRPEVLQARHERHLRGKTEDPNCPVCRQSPEH